MKTIYKSAQKTHWRKASVVLLTCIIYLIFSSCQKVELDQGSTPNLMPSAASSKKVKLTGKVRDVDGNSYNTVKIGNQWWMAENLRTTKYRNRDLIGTTNPSESSIPSDEANPKYQWACGFDDNLIPSYGRWYTWDVGTDSRGVCPTGWHVPSETDWVNLLTYLGSSGPEIFNVSGSLKETGYTHWESPNTGATNSTGFTALPGGSRGPNGIFGNIGKIGYYWSTSESEGYGIEFYLQSGDTNVGKGKADKPNGFSIRCVQN